jgi:hypothetical protein
MLAVTAIVIADLLLRWTTYADEPSTPVVVLALSVVVAVLTGIGGTIGGSLVFDYGFNVETAGDHPVWHPSEHDVMPGRHTQEERATQEATELRRRRSA